MRIVIYSNGLYTAVFCSLCVFCGINCSRQTIDFCVCDGGSRIWMVVYGLREGVQWCSVDLNPILNEGEGCLCYSDINGAVCGPKRQA